MVALICNSWTRLCRNGANTFLFLQEKITMGKFVENNLTKNEKIVKECKPTMLFLIPKWIFGILFCWLLLIPLIKAIIATVQVCNIELALTNKKVAGKVGVANTKTMDIPLNKIQNVAVTQKLGGKIFNYATIEITSAAGKFTYMGMKNAEDFKRAVIAQQDQFDEDRLKEQASQMANAMASAIKKD